MGSEQVFKLDNSFIIENIDDLIQLVDYVPFSFADYNAQEERDEFLKSKNLLATIQEMDHLITAKCEYYEDTAKAWNSVIIEWLIEHPEFEGIIAGESFGDFRNMKENETFIDFVDFLHDVKLPSEKDRIIVDDTSSIRYPNFKKMGEIMNKYPATLLGVYLAYLV